MGVHIGSTIGLTYQLASAGLQAAPPFGNVSVNPAGRFQTDLMALEGEVRDSRYPDVWWAFFGWGPARAPKDAAAPAPPDFANPGQETCVECHTKRTAVERTFVQFNPTLLEVARRMGALKPGF